MRKNIILLLFTFTLTAYAQLERVWVKTYSEIQFASSGGLGADFSTRGVLHSPDGALLMSTFTGKSKHRLIWINSKGELVHAWKVGENAPEFIALVTFNDDYIVTYDNFFHIGSLWVWSIMDGELKTKKTEIPHDGYLSNEVHVFENWKNFSNNSTDFYAVDNNEGKLQITKYRLQTKSPKFFIQQSEDLETWENVLEVPKSDIEKEFFRIAPE